ncbi:Ran-specific GTPase-activating protein 30 [Coemansia sp. RSA 1933]|nr:Ran-specific GTPase-activating protein 30 [Coemansia sp. RSA 1933]
MEDLFSKLAMQTVTLVGKAAFGAAGSMALRRVTAYANRVPQPKGRQAEVDRLRAQFEAKLRIITPAIDLVDIISARGHSTMASVLQLTDALRKDIVAFSAKLDRMDQMVATAIAGSGQSENSSLVSLFRRVTVTSQSQTDESSGDAALASLNDSIVDDLRTLLVNIEDAVPLLNLALTTSGAHLGSSLPPGISPSRLMQASTLLSRASTYHSISTTTDVLVGDPFVLRLYSLFVGSVRPKSKNDFTWKEEYAKCHVALWRLCSQCPEVEEPSDYVYELRIIEDLDDGRYHDDEAPNAPGSPQASEIDSWVAAMNRRSGGTLRAGGRTICIPLNHINSLHYTSAGSLLNIEDSSSPVLVVSRSQDSAKSEDKTDDPAPSNTPVPVELSQQSIDWYALEVMVDDNDDGDNGESSSSDNENATDTESEKYDTPDESSSDSGDEPNDQEKTSKADPPTPFVQPLLSDASQSDTDILAQEYLQPIEFLANEWSRCTLSLLEYTVRLASVEMCEHLPHLEVPDEKLRLYLMGGAPGDPYAIAHGAPLQAATPYSTTTPAVATRSATGFNTTAGTPRRSSVRLPSSVGSPAPKPSRSKSSRWASDLR